MLGHFKKHNTTNYRFVREFRPSYDQDTADYNIGDELNVNLFGSGDTVSVTAKSKGRGYTGVMKRHGFGGFISTHGSHESFRGGGSIGQCAQPSRVFKGVKMAGQHGNAKITTRHLSVVKVDDERGLIMIKGAVPGHRNSLVLIHKEQ
jgi:large subunit ribosomal protein L3